MIALRTSLSVQWMQCMQLDRLSRNVTHVLEITDKTRVSPPKLSSIHEVHIHVQTHVGVGGELRAVCFVSLSVLQTPHNQGHPSSLIFPSDLSSGPPPSSPLPCLSPPPPPPPFSVHIFFGRQLADRETCPVHEYFVSRSGFLTGCIGIFLRHNLPLYLSVAALFLHSFLCNSPDELRTKKLS